jgi:hypothetical protein
LHSWWIRTHNKRSFALTGKSDARALTFAELGVLSAAHFNAIAIAFPMVCAPNQYSRSSNERGRFAIRWAAADVWCVARCAMMYGPTQCSLRALPPWEQCRV